MRMTGNPSKASTAPVAVGVTDCAPAIAARRPGRHSAMRLLAYRYRTKPILSMEAARCCRATLCLQALYVTQPSTNRYSRQIRFAPLGLEGQEQLARSTAV